MLTRFTIGTVMLLAATAAVAQQPVIPDEATKVAALKRAYQLNGDSMTGFGRTIDLSGGIPPADAQCHMVEGAVTGQKFFECDDPPDLNMEDIHKFIRRYNEKRSTDPVMPPSPFKPPPQDMTDRVWADAPARVQVDMVDPGKVNTVDALVSTQMDSVCKRHGLRKVITENGKSWRCQK